MPALHLVAPCEAGGELIGGKLCMKGKEKHAVQSHSEKMLLLKAHSLTGGYRGDGSCPKVLAFAISLLQS